MKGVREIERSLVTGGAGFIGSHLVHCLVQQGAVVTVVDRVTSSDNPKRLRELRDRVTLVKEDLQKGDLVGLLRAVRPSVIFHLAATSYVPSSVERPMEDFGNTLVTTIRLLEALRTGRVAAALILASSGAVYGNPADLPVPEDAVTIPISPYGVSKLAGERYLAVYARLYGLRGASLRFFSVYGPRQRKQIVYDFIRKLSDSPDGLEIIGDGLQRRDMLYVEDAVSAALRVTHDGPLEGETYNVASGRSYSTREIAEHVAKAMRLNPKFRFTGTVRPGDALDWVANIDRLRRLGFAPQVEFAEGLRRTVEWYRQDGRVFGSGT